MTDDKMDTADMTLPLTFFGTTSDGDCYGISYAEIQAWQADAARYQWLKKHRQSESYDGDIGIDFTCDFDNFNNIDASIDAAMKVKP